MDPDEHVLIIRMKGGQLRIDGPIQNKVLALGMIELGKHIVLTLNGEVSNEEKPDILVPGMRMPRGIS